MFQQQQSHQPAIKARDENKNLEIDKKEGKENSETENSESEDEKDSENGEKKKEENENEVTPAPSVSSTKCFSIEFVVFTISAFLPGDYLLRVFPLICKPMKFHRLSLSLLGSSSSKQSETFADHELEAPVNFTESSWRDFQTAMGVKCLLSLICLEAKDSWMLDGLSFPFLERLVIPTHLAGLISINNFPRLTNLEIGGGGLYMRELSILDWVWKLPLVALTLDVKVFSYSYEDPEFVMAHYPSLLLSGCVSLSLSLPPPAFAQTLRSLKTCTWKLLKTLLPHCENLQSLTCPQSRDVIVAANPGLTSLTVTSDDGQNNDAIDLTRFGQLVELKICGRGRFASLGIHPQLHNVILDDCDLFSASQFLSQCSPRHLSWRGCDWRNLVDKIIAVLDPTQCKQLTLRCPQRYPPSLAEVKKVILDKGFQIINGEYYFLDTKDGQERWREVIALVPQIKHWTLLKGKNDIFSSIYGDRRFLTSFHGLIAIDVQSEQQWSQELLSCIVQDCPVLEKLSVKASWFLGSVRLHSTSLRTLFFSIFFEADYSNFDLNLPQLTFLSLRAESGEEVLLDGLLDENPLIHLPILRTLIIEMTQRHYRGRANARKLSCKAGHQTLTQLRVKCDSRTLAISAIQLRKLPWLRQVSLSGLDPTVDVILNVPENCKVDLILDDYTKSSFTHKGGVGNSPYHKQLRYDSEKNKWIETDVELTEKTGRKDIIKRGKPKNRGSRGKGRKIRKKKTKPFNG